MTTAAGPVPQRMLGAHIIQRIVNPGCLVYMKSYDVASNVCQAVEGGAGDDEGGEDEEEDEDDDDYAVVDPAAARVERRIQGSLADHAGALLDLAGGGARDAGGGAVGGAVGGTCGGAAGGGAVAHRPLHEALPAMPPRAHHGKYVYRPKAERPQYRERPVYSTMRTRRARLATAAAAAGDEPPQSSYNPAAVVPSAGEAAAAWAGAGAVAGPNFLPRSEFTARQIGTLHKMMHDHVQLLLTTFARTAWDPGRGGMHHYSLTVINARTPLCTIIASLTVCS